MRTCQLSVCLIFAFLISSCHKKAEDCIYLLPANFQGNVLIVFNQENGMDTSYENEKRVYKIDSNGVLKTKFDGNYGVHQSFFYEIGESNKRIPLRYMLPIHLENISKSSTEIFVYNIETGLDHDQKVGRDRHFELFTVSTVKNLDSIGNLKSRFLGQQLNTP